MRSSYHDNKGDLGPLAMPCWGQPSQACESRDPDARYLPPYGGKDDVLGGQTWRRERVRPHPEGLQPTGCANSPLPMASRGPPSSWQRPPPCPGPPQHSVQVYGDTSVQALGQGGAGRGGDPSSGPWGAAAYEGEPFFKFSQSPCQRLGTIPAACCQRPRRLASSQGQCVHVPADRPALSEGPAPVLAQGRCVL